MLEMLEVDESIVLDVACSGFAVVQAKDSISDSYNSVTWEAIIAGMCEVDVVSVTYEIWY